MNLLRGICLLMIGVFLMVPGPVNAIVACSMTATPKETSVTLNLINCPLGTYVIQIKNSKGDFAIPPIDFPIGNTVDSISKSFGELGKDSYKAILIKSISTGPQIISSVDFTTTGDVVPLICGDVANFDSTCPTECQLTPNINDYSSYTCKIPEAAKVVVPKLAPLVEEAKPGDVFCTIGGVNSVETSNPKVNTALGCVPVKMGDFVTWLLPYLFGIAGGIAFLLMVYGFILMATSQGDPKVVQGARETITSAITGLLISIFALFLLRLIAVDILHIPGIN